MPAFAPFTFHWYAGVVPGFVGVAVNVTEVPMQKGFDEAEMDMSTGKIGLTTIRYWMLDAGLFVIQSGSEEVRMQETRSPFKGV